MFFILNKIEQGAHQTNGLANPKNPGNPMVFVVQRQLMRTALFSVYSKKAVGEFWDSKEQKKIASRLWSPEMKVFAKQKIEDAPAPPFILKITIVGWIFVLLVIATMGLIIYNEVKPPIPKSVEYVEMEKTPVVGDIYFGHYESFKEAGDHVASEIGFGWFKIVKVEGDVYHVAKSTQMNKAYKPKNELNSTNFEDKSTALKITEQAGYLINMESTDDKMEIYITEKK